MLQFHAIAIFRLFRRHHRVNSLFHPAAQMVVDVLGGLGAEMMINTKQQDTQRLVALTVIDSPC